jgi:hypothetical protein
MSKNGGEGETDAKGVGGKLAASLASAAAVFLARKLLSVAWTRTTGKTPPTDPADPEVRLGEAVGWAIVVGITVEIARLFATRALTRRLRADAGPDAVKSR